MKDFSFTAQEAQEGKRVDFVLAETYPKFSRARWREQIQSGRIKVDSRAVKASEKLKNGSLINGEFPTISNQNLLISPDSVPEIIYKDKDVLVINKPTGLVVYTTTNNPQPSVAGAFKSLINDSDPVRPGIVHRLDKDTSGVMILARNDHAKEFLLSAFKQRRIEKHYTALVVGRPNNDRARLELPIKRGIKNPQKMSIHSSGKSAISEYQLIKEYNGYSLLDVSILTGRTHQIRVQFAHIGHPIAGDKQYGNKKADSLFTRQFLHASSISLELPSRKPKVFKANLPADLENILTKLS